MTVLAVPTNFNIVAIRPLRGSGLIVCEPALVFGVIESLYGGAGKFQTRIEGRDFSATEQRVINRLVNVITEEYKKAWTGFHSLELDYQRSGNAASVCQCSNAKRNCHLHVVPAGNRDHGGGPFLYTLRNT